MPSSQPQQFSSDGAVPSSEAQFPYADDSNLHFLHNSLGELFLDVPTSTAMPELRFTQSNCPSMSTTETTCLSNLLSTSQALQQALDQTPEEIRLDGLLSVVSKARSCISQALKCITCLGNTDTLLAIYIHFWQIEYLSTRVPDVLTPGPQDMSNESNSNANTDNLKDGSYEDMRHGNLSPPLNKTAHHGTGADSASVPQQQVMDGGPGSSSPSSISTNVFLGDYQVIDVRLQAALVKDIVQHEFQSCRDMFHEYQRHLDRARKTERFDLSSGLVWSLMEHLRRSIP